MNPTINKDDDAVTITENPSPLSSTEPNAVAATTSPEGVKRAMSLDFMTFSKKSNPSEYEALFKEAVTIRDAVFIQEQNVPLEEELDSYDEEAVHWLVRDTETGEAVATARLLYYQEGCQMKPVAKIGRVAVLPTYRGQRIATRLMETIMVWALQQGYDQSLVEAQTYIIPLYEKLGYEVESDEYLDAGIPHKMMRAYLKN